MQKSEGLAMRAGSLIFRPRPIPSLAVLLLLPLLLGLGFWQLDRARQKEALAAGFAGQLDLPTVPLAAVDPVDPGSRYRKVSVAGRYDGEHQLLLDNQIRDGRPGYHVYTPLRTATAAILINRGWVPWGESRRPLPDVAIARREVTLEGRLAQPANPGLRLDGAETAGSDWPKVIQHVDYDRLATALGYPLIPAVVLLDPQAADGYRRDWQPAFGRFGPQRHRGYALQWFALAATLAAIFIVVNVRREDRIG